MDKDFILILTIVESAQIILKYFVTSLQQNVNDKNYFMIPTKICLICNEDLYSQLMTGRIKDIF